MQGFAYWELLLKRNNPRKGQSFMHHDIYGSIVSFGENLKIAKSNIRKAWNKLSSSNQRTVL